MSKNIKVALDKERNIMQFGHIDTPSFQNITSATELSSTETRYVVVTPTTSDAWIQVKSATFSPAVSVGKFIPFGGDYTLIVRAGEFIGSDTEINVVPIGEL